jgi:hypothetical protein
LFHPQVDYVLSGFNPTLPSVSVFDHCTLSFQNLKNPKWQIILLLST